MVELNQILYKDLRGECTLKVKLTNMQYIPTHTLIYEELFLDEILNLKKENRYFKKISILISKLLILHKILL